MAVLNGERTGEGPVERVELALAVGRPGGMRRSSPGAGRRV